MRAAARVRRIERDRPPELGRAIGKVELLRHHADDRDRRAVQRDRSPDDAGFAAEPLLPHAVADDDDGVLAGLILLGRERAAKRGRHAQQLERVPRDLRALQPLGAVRPDERRARALIRREALEHRVLLAPVEKRRRRHRELPVLRHDLVHAHELAGLRIRQRLQQHAVDHAEDRGRRAHAQGERQHGHDREARRLDQLPNRVARIAQNVSKHQSSSRRSRPRFDRAHQPIGRGPQVRAVGPPHVRGHPGPIRDLRLRVGVGVRIRRAARDGVAIEILELRGDLPDDAGLALGREIRKIQVRSDERAPITHRPRPSRR